MGKFLFGISTFCRRLIDSGEISVREVDGLFDNDPSKIGQIRYGLPVGKPRYIEGAQIIITVANDFYRLEAVRQLVGLGYVECTMICEKAEKYERKHLDFSRYHHKKGKNQLIVLYLQHKSYSGISAIEYMIKNGKISLPAGFCIATMTAKEDETGFYYYAAMADYFITERDLLKVCGKRIQLWHGFPLKALGHMMKSFKSEGYDVSNKWAEYNHIVSYGQMYTDFMCACYGTPANQYWITGMPRNDLLYLTDGKTELCELMPDSIGKRVVLYMPTFRQLEHKKSSYMQVDGMEEGYIFYWEDFRINRLEQFCEENNIYFVFKLHPSDASRAKTWYVKSPYIGIMTDEMLGDKCMYEYLNAADVLVTDYSSVYFDYLLLDRPIVFTDKDVDVYVEQRGLILEPLDFWRPGAAVHTMDMLEKEIADALGGRDRYQEKRKCLTGLVHRYRDGCSTERLFEMIRKDSET